MAPSAIVTAPEWMQLAFWISFYAWIGFETWVWMRERGHARGQSRDRGSVLWLMAWIWIGIWAGFFFMFHGPGAIASGATVWFVVGLVLLYLGIAFRFWAIQTLGQFFRTRVQIFDEHHIITHGPYRWLRNPAYSGTTLTMIGMGLAMRNWLSVACLFVGSVVAYARRIAVEQRALEAHFGAPYRDYIKRTWALIPFIW